MGLRLRTGRLLTDSDSATSQPVLVVNKSFADQYLGDDPFQQNQEKNLRDTIEALLKEPAGSKK